MIEGGSARGWGRVGVGGTQERAEALEVAGAGSATINKWCNSPMALPPSKGLASLPGQNNPQLDFQELSLVT